MRKLLLENSLISTLSYGISSVLWLFLVPFILNNIGPETYGIWALASIVISATNLVNLGIPSALTKYTADFYAKKTVGNIKRLLQIADLAFLSILIIALAILVPLRDAIIEGLFNVEGSQASVLRTLLPLMVLLSFVFLLKMNRKAVVDGFQEIRFSSLITLLGRFTNFIVTIVFIQMQFGIWSLFYAALFENLISFATYTLFLNRRFFRSDRYIKDEYNWPYLKDIIFKSLRFGTGLQLSVLLGFGLELFYKTFITNTLGLGYLGLFQVAWRATQILQGLVTAALRPIFPASALFVGEQNASRLKNLYTRATKYSVFLGSSIIILLIPFAGLIFHLWIGESSDFQIITFQMLCLWVFFSTLTAPGYLYLMGAGRATGIITIQASGSAISLLLAILPLILNLNEYPWVMVGLSYAVGGLVNLGVTLILTQLEFNWNTFDIFRDVGLPRLALKFGLLFGTALVLTSLFPDNLIRALLFSAFSVAFLLLLAQEIPQDDIAVILNTLKRKFTNAV